MFSRTSVRVLPAAILLLSACASDESVTGRTPVFARTAVSRVALRPHVEHIPVSLEGPTGGAVDWGNLRIVLRVVVPQSRAERGLPGGATTPADSPAQGSTHAEAERMAAAIAASVRVDSRDTLSGLLPDAGALKRWTTALLRPTGRRLLQTGASEETYEIPLTGVGGIIDGLYNKASRATDVLTGPVPGSTQEAGPLPSAPLFSSRSAPVPLLARALAAATGEARDTEAMLDSFKGLVEGDTSADSDGTPAILIDARGTSLLPALFPLVLDEAGRPVYGAASAPRERVAGYANGGGLAQYVELAPGTDLDGLAALPGLRRLVVVEAIAAEGPLRANVILKTSEARRVRAEQASLEEARVVIVLGQSR